MEAVLDGQNRLLHLTEFDAEGEERHRQRRERATTGPPAHSRIPVARDGRPLGRPGFGHVCKPSATPKKGRMNEKASQATQHRTGKRKGSQTI